MAPEGGVCVCVCVCTYPCMLSGPPNRGEDAWDSVTSVKFLCPHLIPPILHCYHVELVQCVPLINLGEPFAKDWASLVAQMVQNPPAMQETSVRSLGPEDPLEKGMATHSSILAWRIPRTEEPGGLQSTGLQRVKHS